MGNSGRSLTIPYVFSSDKLHDTEKALNEIVMTMSALTYSMIYGSNKKELNNNPIVRVKELIPLFLKNDVSITTSEFKSRLIQATSNSKSPARNFSFLTTGDRLRASFSVIYGSFPYVSDIFKSISTSGNEYGDYYTRYRRSPKRKPITCSYTNARSPFNYLVDPEVLGLGRNDSLLKITECLEVMLSGYGLSDFKSCLSSTSTYDRTIIDGGEVFKTMRNMIIDSNNTHDAEVIDTLREDIKNVFKSLNSLSIDDLSGITQSSLNIVCGRRTPFPLGRENNQWNLTTKAVNNYHNVIKRNCSKSNRQVSYISSIKSAMNVDNEINGRDPTGYYIPRCERAMKFSMLFPYLNVIRPESFLSSPFTAAINLTLSLEIDKELVEMVRGIDEINSKLVKVFNLCIEKLHKEQVDKAVKDEIYRSIPYEADTPIYSTVKKEVERIRRKELNTKVLTDAKKEAESIGVRIPYRYLMDDRDTDISTEEGYDCCDGLEDCCDSPSEYPSSTYSVSSFKAKYSLCDGDTIPDIKASKYRDGSSVDIISTDGGKTWSRKEDVQQFPRIQNLLYTRNNCSRSDTCFLKYVANKSKNSLYRDNIEIEGEQLYLTSEMIGYSLNYLMSAVEYFYIPTLKLYNFLTEVEIIVDDIKVRESLEFPIRFLMYQLNLELFHHISKENIKETIGLTKEVSNLKEIIETNEFYNKYLDKSSLEKMKNKMESLIWLKPSFIADSEKVEEYSVNHDMETPIHLRDKLKEFKVEIANMERKICLEALTLDGIPVKNIKTIEES